MLKFKKNGEFMGKEVFGTMGLVALFTYTWGRYTVDITNLNKKFKMFPLKISDYIEIFIFTISHPLTVIS